ncbi:MAG: LPS export ABC transporter ATP-binding protein [Flavobacteriales bacterium]|nr:LPS export ABC transporter ATP-binding protein [Flavobacteriales bacterium]|tara:strand:+ start:15886 stop:16605 length:720 start_codon:yes stop_codon:yes gene_type:complete
MKLEVLNITKKYNQRKVVNDVSFEINKGEIIGLLGPNGAGKTTSFYILVGLVNPNEGKVLLNGEDISKNPMYIRARKGISYLAQEPSIFRKMSVEDNILCILEYLNNNKKENEVILNQLINEFGLNKIRKNRGDLLSGGERRRVEIARSIAVNPSFILLDEPFAGVDPIAIQELQQMIYKLKSKGIGVLITDHNVRETLSITDRSYLLYDGKILKAGTSNELAKDEEVKKLYLGKNFNL